MESDWADINGPLSEGLFHKDDAGRMDGGCSGHGSNTSLGDRASYTANSKILELQGRLHIDLFRQERMLINGLQVTIKMSQTTEPFRILRATPTRSARATPSGSASGDSSETPRGDTPGSSTTTTSAPREYRVEIVNAVLKEPMVKPTPSMTFGIEHDLTRDTVKYPFERTEVKTAAIPSGMSHWPLENLFLSAHPERLVVALLPSAAYNGDYSRNPFNFANFKVNYMCLTIDGSCVPSQAFQLDYDNDIFLDSYTSLFSIAPDPRIGRARKLTTIDRGSYKNGYCMYVFNIDGGTQGSQFVSPQNIGLNKLDIRFAERLSEPVTVLLYATYNALLHVDIKRTIRLEG